MTTVTLTIHYHCALCAPQGRSFDVRERGVGEDATDWMAYAAHRAMLAHDEDSPHCHSDSIRLQIDVAPGAMGGVGFAARH